MESGIYPMAGAYAGYVSDAEELRSCTSGGIATALSRHMIGQGGAVAGVAYSSDFYTAQYEIAAHPSALERFKGSKYIEVQKGTIYKDVETLLLSGKQVLFFGLPCAISALKTCLAKEYENLFTVALICHGPTYHQVHRQYLDHLEQQFKSKIVDFSVRRKDGGWTPPFLYAKFENGQVFQRKFNDTEYGKAFYTLSKQGCYTCPFRNGPRRWDLTIGDYWGAKETDPFWNKDGVSAILAHTEKGLAFLMETPDIRLFDTTVEKVIEGNPCLVSPRQEPAGRAEFLQNFQKNGLFHAVNAKKIPGP